MSLLRLGLIANDSKPGAGELARDIALAFERNGIRPLLDAAYISQAQYFPSFNFY